MIILDTNVVSEPLKPKPSPVVLDWLDQQDPQTLFLTTISLAELLAGVEVLPTGRRKDALANALTTQVFTLFGERILAMDTRAAEFFAKARAGAQSQGNTIGFADCAIASIALAHGFLIATRNTSDFIGCGVDLIDPWTSL
jgi:predicted nucleic acid-binding protein